MTLLPFDTPLYNHPLPEIEQWLLSLGGVQDDTELHCWCLTTDTWQAELSLEVEELTVRYHLLVNQEPDVYRAFKYSLTRGDVENAILGGP
jgi:Protein of unknown function (DUF3143)